MKQKIILTALLCCGLVLVFVTWRLPNKIQPKQNAQSLVSSETHRAYFMQAEFYTGILKPDNIAPLSETIYGGIVSHHFFVERNIADLYAQWSKQNIQTIVILGPNHFNQGSGHLIISREAYKTPWGNLEPNLGVVDKLISQGLVSNEESPFTLEHSISVEAGFIKHDFPNAKIVPIILKHDTSKDKVDALAQALAIELPENSIVLASVDFSHHVTNIVAEKQDSETLSLMKAWDLDGILKRNYAEMDSPVTIYTLMKYLELKNAKNMKYINTNQALLSGNLKSTDVTSYVFASFMK